MKNLMVYILSNENKWTNIENPTDLSPLLIAYIKAQIDNSIELKWNVNDIILATNFDFEYRGVKNYYLQSCSKDLVFCSKVQAIYEL
ncbi:hypothetical protein LCGC14_1688480, partial [marine sediment metagenome]